MQGYILVRESTVATASNGSSYLNLKVSDGTKEVPAKKWDFTGEPPREGDIIYVEAEHNTYKGQDQLIIMRYRLAEEGEVDPTEFLPSIPLDQRKGYFENIVAACNNYSARYGNVVSDVYNAYEQDIIGAPAAVNHHHAFVGGLLQHTDEVLSHASSLGTKTGVNLGLLSAGAALHDIGKIMAYQWSRPPISVSDKGKLHDHIFYSAFITQRYSEQLPEQDRDLLLHLILSHHGKLEWGSPVVPKILEAEILHQADMLSTMQNKYEKAAEEAPQGVSWQKVWSLGNKEVYLR